MSGSSSPDYKALFLKAEEERKKAEERQRQAEERERQERERNRPTTLEEFIGHCHDLLWRPLRVEVPSRSTTGTIPPPTGKYCPIRLRPWTDCAARQREVYASVCRYLQPTEEDAQQLFAPLVELEGLGRRFALRPISSEQDLESYERFAVEDHVRDIISELCKIPAAREEFGLGDGVWFDNHANALDEVGLSGSDTRPSRPDQFCIHRVDGQSNTLLTTVEYKPPHKLSVQTIREGLRPMDFWQEIVKPDTIPTDGPERQRYNAARLAGSVAVQQFHGMIQYGVGCSSITNGLIDVQLWVPFDDPTTLYYDVGDPDIKRHADFRNVRGPRTRVERALCSCLMSFRTPLRDQAWRNAAKARLPIWHTSFDSERSRIPAAELPQDANVDYTSSEYTSPEQSTSEYLPSSSPAGSPVTKGRRVTARAASGCAPASDQHPQEDSSDSEVNPAASAGRKRGFSQVTSSPSSQHSAPRTDSQRNQSGQSRPHVAEYCTQKCLLGLQQGGTLDPDCPNTKLHTLGGSDVRHPISVEDLVKKLKTQLDQDLDHNCTPIGPCGSYGAPFKISCATFGYTIVAKGTTSKLWKEVSREAEVYRVLQRAQGSAVPVFLGAINLAQIYFLHGAGEIRHMLLMGWGGERVGHTTLNDTIQRAISRSVKEIRSLGVFHQDLRPDNVLWNAELKRALIIDFHRCTLNHRPMHKRPRSLKRLRCGTEECESKRVRVV
jgi:hypothetical protein